MRRTQRPPSWGTLPTRKIFNCIVDDRALVAGAKKSTRDGIRKWVVGGQIRLFVPLYTLEQTSRLKEGTGRIASEAEEALLWLDTATTDHPDRVTLQGGYEKFDTWAQVEKFALPKTLFSENDLEEGDAADAIAEQENSLDQLHISSRGSRGSISSVESQISGSAAPSSKAAHSVSPLSLPSSPAKTTRSVRSPDPLAIGSNAPALSGESAEDGVAKSGVPQQLRPLFNYILWRIHQEQDPEAALENFIFLSDDPFKNKIAQGFGIRSKTLSDIRYVVAREGRELRNRQLVQKKENEQNGTQTPALPAIDKNAAAHENVDDLKGSVSDNDEDEVLFRRTPRAPAAMMTPQTPSSNKKVVDPNQFSRSPQTAPARGSPRGNFRGSVRSRGGFSDRGSARDNGSGPIDPDSFSRPAPNNRMRGGRRLWIPT